MRPGSGRNDQKIERRRRDRAANCAGDRQRGRAPPCEVADREFALDLEAHDEKEDGEQSVVDPMQQRQRKAEPVEREPEFLLPERGETRS